MTQTRSRSISAPIPTSPAAQQVFRRIKRNERLHSDIKSLARASGDHDYIGANAPVEAMAARLGFKSFDLAIADIRCSTIVTFIVVPFAIWQDKVLRGRAIKLRSEAKSAGHHVILVPQAVLQREPRLSNARLVSRSAKLRLDATGVMSVLGHLVEHGASPVSELAELLTHFDPIGAIFGMLVNGDISIDMSEPITPMTLVDLGKRYRS